MSGFYYFALIDNFESIISNGILSNEIVNKNGIQRADFSNQSVQLRRKEMGLHEFVPLYFVSKTPTLYAVQHLQESIFFIEVNKQIIRKEGKIVLFTDGNAASNGTTFFDNISEAKKNIHWDVLAANYWTGFEDGTRKRNSEVLIYEKVETIYFNKIIVNNRKLFEFIKRKLDDIKWKGLNKNFQIEQNSSYFF